MLVNHYNSLEQRFPFILLDNTILLSKDEQRTELKNLWNAIINSKDIASKDIEYWMNNKFPFSNLFKQDSNATIFYNYIKKTYEHWYWGTGNCLCSSFSDNLVEQYYHEITSLAVSKKVKLEKEMHLQIVYNSPPQGWEKYSSNMVIMSPDYPLPTAEEILMNIL
jgi:hypothetical protein